MRKEETPAKEAEPQPTAVAVASNKQVEKLQQDVAELRQLIKAMEKKHCAEIKALEDKLTKDVDMLTNDFDEERKNNAALKVELDRIKRRLARSGNAE